MPEGSPVSSQDLANLQAALDKAPQGVKPGAEISFEKTLPVDNPYGLDPNQTFGLTDPKNPNQVRLFMHPIQRAGLNPTDVAMHELGHSFHNANVVPSEFTTAYEQGVKSYLKGQMPGPTRAPSTRSPNG